MKIRPTQLSDLSFVLDAERHADNAPYINQWSIAQHERAITSSDEGHFIAEKAGTLMGYLIVAGLQDPHQALLLRRIVAVEKGQGYGRAMLKWVKSYTFEQLDYHRLWLDVVASNQRAQSLYLSEGFAVEGTLREAYKSQYGFEDMLILSLLRSEFDRL
ncbi:MAG: GNAT family protein [Cyanobacteria bacterium J06621_11]